MSNGIVIVSLGPGDPDLLNGKTLQALKSASPLFLRTGRHPIVSWLDSLQIPYSTLDQLYDDSEDFDQLNRKAAELLICKASGSEIVYAVPDALTDQTVRTLFNIKPDHLPVSVIPGLSACDLHLSASLPFLPDTSILVVPASDFSDSFRYDPGLSLLITELDNLILAGQVKLVLSELLEDDYPVFLLQENQSPVMLPLWQLDRQPAIDHRFAVLVPGSDMLSRKRFVMNDLTALMDRLRSPSGCPWDRVQTHASLRPYMIEEAWECVASIDQHDTDHLCEELGDLLFQVVFHSSIGKAFDEFTLNDVITAICMKMIRRHPHVFGDADLKDAESVRAVWETIKQDETGHTTAISSLDDVSSGLPSLKYASKTFRKLSATSFVRSDPAEVLTDISELISSLRSDPESADPDAPGRLLLLCSEYCYIIGSDSELLLHQTVDRIKSRLKSAEKIIIRDGKTLEDLTFQELGVYLNHVEGEIE